MLYFHGGSYQPVGPPGPGSAAIAVLMEEKEREHGKKVSFQQIWNKTFFPPLLLHFKTPGPGRPKQRAIWIFKQKNRMECINQAVVNV